MTEPAPVTAIDHVRITAAAVVVAVVMTLAGVVAQPAYAAPDCNAANPPPICDEERPPPPPPPKPDPDAPVWAQCENSSGWHGPPAPTNLGGGAPLAITEDAPFGYPLHAGPPSMVEFLRCVAIFASKGARVGVFCPQAGIAMDLKYNPALADGSARILATNGSDRGKWFVTHLSGVGENASRWVESGTRTPQYLFTIADPAKSAPVALMRAGTMGFVRTDLFGIADPECSFTWTSFWPLVNRMDVTYGWVY
jgi:hypothetical protein